MLRRAGQRRYASGWDFLYGKSEVKRNDMEEHALDPETKAKIDEHLNWAYRHGKKTPPKSLDKSIDRSIDKSFDRPLDKSPRMVMKQHERTSTLTHRERAVFSKIFDTILNKDTPQSPRSSRDESASKRAKYKRLVQQATNSAPQAPPEETLSFEPGDRKPPPSLYQVFEAPSLGDAPSDQLEALHACRTNIEVLTFADERVFAPFAEKRVVDAQPMQFPELLGHVMRTLREEFGDAAGAVSIFERAKRQSAESYVAGCSTNVYNEMIATKWHDYRDVQGVEELVEEMMLNGVDGDARTVELLRTVVAHVEQSAEPWWVKDDRVRIARLVDARQQIMNTLHQPQPFDDGV